jgi:AraC-like DNA-binding protein
MIWYNHAIMVVSTFQKKIKDLLDSFGRISGQGAIYHPQDGGGVMFNAQTCAFCAYSLKHAVTGDYCRFACHGGAMQTLSSGEPDYQRCWAGLLIVTVAAAPRGAYRGGIESGGYIAEGERDDIEDMMQARLAAIPNVDPVPFLERIKSVRELSASALRGLGLLLLENTFSAGVNSSRFVQKQHARYEQQRQIADAYATLQGRRVTPPDVLGDTYQLVAYLHRGDREGAMQFISEYLAKLLLISQWNLTRLRAHVRVLIAVITSQDVLGGMDWTAATSREMLAMARIEKASDVESICSEVAELVLAHFGRLDAEDQSRVLLSDRVLAWLRGHYHEPATLRDAARAVGASVSAIAHRLPEETGKSYSRLRLELRISEAKRLLAETDMGISEIAETCGFSDQSHLTRCFRDAVNLTPGRFRALLDPETAVLSPVEK